MGAIEELLTLSSNLRTRLRQFKGRRLTPGLLAKATVIADRTVTEYRDAVYPLPAKHTVAVRAGEDALRVDISRDIIKFPVDPAELIEAQDYCIATDEEIRRLRSSNAYKAQLLEAASKLIAAVVEERFNLSKASESFKDGFRDFLTKTWSE